MNWNIKINDNQIMLGALNQEQAAKLLNMIYNEKQIAPSQCFDETFITATMKTWHKSGDLVCKTTPEIEFDTFINNQFSSTGPTHIKGTRTLCGCADQSKCTQHLLAGKCTDKFMRNTIGKIICPHLYGKEK